jgi:hypothetical protein
VGVFSVQIPYSNPPIDVQRIRITGRIVIQATVREWVHL